MPVQALRVVSMARNGAVRDDAQLLELKGDAEALDRALKKEVRHADGLLTGISGRINHTAFQLG
jgi:hypothetical protein